MRSLTGNATTEKNKTSGAGPRIILKIEFGGAVGDQYFADEDLTSPVAADGRILNASAIQIGLAGRGVGAADQVSVRLSTDATLRGYLSSVVWALKKVTIFQHFSGNDAADLVPLLVGYIDDSPVWSDADGTVRFDVTDIATRHDVTVGHVASSSDFSGISTDEEGRGLPLVFGRVRDLRCVQVVGGEKGSLLSDLSITDTSAVIEGGEDFPQGETITVRVNGEYIKGVMTGKEFVISERNASIYAGMTTANTADNPSAVYDTAAPERDNLFSGLCVDFGSGYWRNRIDRYYGSTGKFVLKGPMIVNGAATPAVIGAGSAFDVIGVYTSPTIQYAGSTVEVADSATVYYLANDARSLEVHRVYALKQYEIAVSVTGQKQTVEQLVELDSDKYSVNTNDTTTFPSLGRAVTTICLPQAPTQLEDEQWASDEIWVELSGYTRDGSTMIQNPAEVLRYLLEDFGGVDSGNIDSSSFSSAASSLSHRRFAFALTEPRNLRALIADLAMQAQCELAALGGTYYCWYQDDTPGTSRATMDESPGGGAAGLAEDTLERRWTPLSDLWTEVECTYRPDLSGRRGSDVNRFVLRHATSESDYGRRSHALDLWAYRDQNHAKAAAQYYLNHHARPWERPRFGCYLDVLQLLPSDWVTVGDLGWWDAGQQGRVSAVEHASGGEGETDRIGLELFLPIYPGCAGTCEVPCETGGCEGAAEWDCAGAAETSCVSACETSCQEACELTCVTECQYGCTVACQQTCQTVCEAQACEGAACESSCEWACETSCESGNEDACDTAACETSCEWACETGGCQMTCEMDGCQAASETGCLGANETGCGTCETSCQGWCQADCETGSEVACGSSCETGGCECAGCQTSCELACETWCETGSCETGDETVGPDYGFLVSAPASVSRDTAFDVALQSYDISTGEFDTSYTPAGDVTISGECSDGEDYLLPAYTENTGWSDGKKTVSCTVDGGSDGDTCEITVTDPASGRTGSITVMVSATSLSPETEMPVYSKSFEDYPGGVRYGGTQNASGWQSEWDEAHDPTTSHDGHGGPGATSDSDLLIRLHHQVSYDFSESEYRPMAAMGRLMLGFDVSSYKGTSHGANLKISANAFFARWGGVVTDQWYDSDPEGVLLYAVSSDPSGEYHEKFNDMYTLVASGTLCDSVSVSAMRNAYDDSGVLSFHVPAAVVNGLADDTLRLVLITKWDRDDTPIGSYPGHDTSYNLPQLTVYFDAIHLEIT